jgi:hypothetical protein
MALAGSVAYALSASSTSDEFASYGDEALISTVVGGVIGAGFGYALHSINRANEPFVPDEYWEKKAPMSSTPGSKFYHYREDDGVIEKSLVIYDNYGRQMYRIDYNNHARGSSHSIPHLHEYIYGPGYALGFDIKWNIWRV